jgi:hypothetical protein
MEDKIQRAKLDLNGASEHFSKAMKAAALSMTDFAIITAKFLEINKKTQNEKTTTSRRFVNRIARHRTRLHHYKSAEINRF